MSTTTFAPHLQAKNVLVGIEYYKKAFGAAELPRWENPDGTVHVAEMSIGGALFHIHEAVSGKKQMSPKTLNGVTNLIGIFVPDPDTMIDRAIAEGGVLLSPMQDYDYG
jgi:PhnB protein